MSSRRLSPWKICFGVPAALAGDVYALHQTLELTIGARAGNRLPVHAGER